MDYIWVVRINSQELLPEECEKEVLGLSGK